MSKPVITRIAPSPTGRMHIGTVRTALFNFLFAKHFGGKFYIRIEDTDKERDRPEYTEQIWRDFEWCGLIPDATFIQSEHAPLHAKKLQEIVDRGVAYVSREPSQKDPTQFVEVVRLKNPGKTITFHDLVRGPVSFDTGELGDFVIARSIHDPLYHFAVVVDDAEAGVTHVLRAEEHISNTPRQILIQEALGIERPIYGHLPLILAPDRSKLSKRKHAASIDIFRDRGFSPEALINYLALLGWNPGTEQELFSMTELIATFTIDGVQKSGAIFDEEKLKWFNREWLKKMPGAEFESAAIARLFGRFGTLPQWSHERAALTLPVVRDRISVLDDINILADTGEFKFFFTEPTLQKTRLVWKSETPEVSAGYLKHVVEMLEELATESTPRTDADSMKAYLMPYAESIGRGNVLWPLRYALTGEEKSPDPFTVLSILGIAESIRRIKHAISLLT